MWSEFEEAGGAFGVESSKSAVEVVDGWRAPSERVIGRKASQLESSRVDWLGDDEAEGVVRQGPLAFCVCGCGMQKGEERVS